MSNLKRDSKWCQQSVTILNSLPNAALVVCLQDRLKFVESEIKNVKLLQIFDKEDFFLQRLETEMLSGLEYYNPLLAIELIQSSEIHRAEIK